MPIFIAAGSVAALLVLRFLILLWLRHYKHVGETHKIIIRVVRIPSFFWCIIAGLRVGTEFWHLEDRLHEIATMTIAILAIVSITMAVSRVLEEMASHYLERIGSSLARSGLIRGVIVGLTFTLGSLILLSRLGVKIEALLTALGVGGLAVSLALQDTLSNVFAGIGLLIDRSIDLGDQIKLEGGQEGTVEDIGWRTTRLRMTSSDLLVIPNIKLAQSISIRKTKSPN